MNNSASKIKQVNQSIGDVARLGIFSATQFAVFGVVFCLVFVLVITLGASILWSLVSAFWASTTVLILSGDRPYLFWSKIYPTAPYWVRGYAKYISPQMKQKLGNKKVKVSRQSVKKLSPFEDWLDLTTLVRLKKGGHLAGAYLLSKKQIGSPNNTLQLVFGYSCTGIHPVFNSDEQVEALAQAFENGCKDLPQIEKFTFRWSSFCDDAEAREYFGKRVKSPVSLESKFLDYGQLARIQELTREHSRKNIVLNIYTTYTATTSDGTSGDFLDNLINKLGVFIQKRFSKEGISEITKKQLIQILNNGIEASTRHQQILDEMGFEPQPKTEVQLWKELCSKVGTNPVKVPHTLVFDELGLREEFNENSDFKNLSQTIDEAHATSVLLNNGVPYADRRWVCYSSQTHGKKYVGVMTLSRKPEAFSSTAGQARFLWDVFSKNTIYDVEVITEINPADRKLARLAQQTITKRSRAAELNTEKFKTIDVASQISVKRSVEAQEKLYTGDVPLNLALVVLVYRDTPERVDEACRLIQGYINQPAELTRETEYAWFIWLQTLLVRQEKILLRPYNRRLTFFASELLGLTNAIQIAPADAEGFELISDEGHSSIKIDVSLFKNILVLGATGCGKSLIIAALFTECIAQGMSGIIIDFPNPDGTGTFGDYTPYFNGFYFDISKESNNLMQPLDLSEIPEDDIEGRNYRLQNHRNDINTIVEQLVLGAQSFDGLIASTIESLIPLGVEAFYQDPEIQQRFVLAQKQGIGSSAWADTPTLVDLEPFFSKERLNLRHEEEKTVEALNFIRLRLRYWQASSIGNAICKPSSFNTNSKLITFALTNLQSGKAAEVLGLSAYMAASRQSLSCPKSVFFMDEASVLLGYPALGSLVGRKCATARKSGSRVILAGQDVSSIADSEAGTKILENMPCRLIGKIVPGAAKKITEILGVPEQIIAKNQSFYPKQKQMYTLWLLDYKDKYVRCRYYPSAPLIALVANSREEQAARDRFKQIYSSKFKWVSEFSKYYVERIRQGEKL
ncbi:AAA family ATPase (plasmid) [Nostoc sp. UHCC 0302]|uniref:AAA family ATPase n=1 Tax=Nostoc sp. UHCC 0302 TaxID=3134896 RepID=UPI00311CB6D8